MTLEEMKRVKQERGYSVAQLSEYTGVPLGTLQKIFAGITASPRFATRQALERVLGAEEGAEDSLVRERNTYGTSALQDDSSQEKKQGEYTLEDYYTFPDERRVELIDGVVYDMTAPSFVHQRIAGDIYYQLLMQIEGRNSSCQPMVSPVDVRLDCDDRTMVQPDVLILCDPNKIRRWGIDGAPDFILEVLSKSTKWMDCMKKLYKYQQAGVKEYWIIDPQQKKLSVYDFEQEGWPQVFDLKGKLGLAMYQKQIVIDLDRIAPMIQEYPD